MTQRSSVSSETEPLKSTVVHEHFQCSASVCLATVGVQQQEQIFGGDAKPSPEHTPGFVQESRAEQSSHSKV